MASDATPEESAQGGKNGTGVLRQDKAQPQIRGAGAATGAYARNLTIAMLVIYFGFILLVAFDKGFLGTPISADSVTTIGIPLGLFVIVAAFVLPGIYVAKANSTFDELNTQVLEESN